MDVWGSIPCGDIMDEKIWRKYIGETLSPDDPLYKIKKAYSEGYDIEVNQEDNRGWLKIRKPNFDAPPQDYRIIGFKTKTLRFME